MSILKKFLQTYNVYETYNGKPCFLSITKFLQGQARTDLKWVYFDEDNFVVWAYNPQGWVNRAQALEWVLQQYMCLQTRRVITQRPKRPQPVNAETKQPQPQPIQLVHSTTQQSIVHQRQRTWNEPTQQQQNTQPIPKRKVKRTLETEIEREVKPEQKTEPTQMVEKVEEKRPQREPANLKKMEYLKGVFSQLS